MPTRWQFRYCLLTYSQCGDTDPFDVVNHLSTLGAECIIGRELHQDGGIHLHAFVDFGRKFRSRDVRAFDVNGCHPNVEPTRLSPAAGWDYATKDGDIVAGGLERPGGAASEATHWATICAASDAEEFWQLCESLAPRTLLCSFNSLRSYADWRFKPRPTVYEQPRGITVNADAVPGLGRWVQENLVGHQSGR